MTSENPDNPASPQPADTDADLKSREQASNPQPTPSPEALQPQSAPPKHGCDVTCNIRKDCIDWLTLGLETFGLVVLIVYTIATVAIWCANKKAADAAAGANKIATKTMRIDQRAWLSPHIIHQIFSKDQPLVVATQFDNTGKSPAIHVQTCVVAEVVEKTREDVDISCPESSKSPGLDVIFPGGHVARLSNATGKGGKTDIDPQGLLREPLMKELRGWSKTVYVYGRVDYWDVFKKPHWATFCSTMLIMPPTSGGMPETVSWTTCQNGNGVDVEDEEKER